MRPSLPLPPLPENAASSEEISASVEEQNAAMEEINHMAASLK